MWIGEGDVLANDTNGVMGASGATGAKSVPLVEFRDVLFSYAGHTVVDGVSLQVDRGELVALLGPNGCGKTTIMRLINGLELADAGAYLFDGHVIDAAYLKDSATAQRFHQRVGFVFQNADAQLFCARWARKSLLARLKWGCRRASLTVACAMPWNCFKLPIWSTPLPISFRAGKRSAWRWLRRCR